MMLKKIKRVYLTLLHERTGKTIHYNAGLKVDKPTQLIIAKYEDCSGYYLLHIDKEGKEMTDTYHETIEDALEQADFEFGVQPEEWEEE